MTPRTEANIETPAGDYRGLAAAQIQLKKEREKALEWVSHNALSTVRNTWRKAKLSDRRSK
jgi:hypothetical protein